MNANDSVGDQDGAAVPALSPEFLAGGTEAGLEKIRTRLIDLTNRNRLLNFRHTTASSLRVADSDLDAVLRSLIDGQKVAFVPVPEPDHEYDPDLASQETGRQKLPAADHARSIGWPASYDMEPSTERRWRCDPAGTSLRRGA